LCSTQTSHDSLEQEISSELSFISAEQRAGFLKNLGFEQRQVFSKEELQAQCSFLMEHPDLAMGSLVTWKLFKEETGSRRELRSLRSSCDSRAFKGLLTSLQAQRKMALHSSCLSVRMDGMGSNELCVIKGHAQSPSSGSRYDSNETNDAMFEDSCCCS